uniref:C2H2-type domain-containing protein n=1 Tax=Strongyloides papillosus TaxID=174720 RepID=A0A0N5BB56_STREA
MVDHIESHYEYRCQKDGCNKGFIYRCSLQEHDHNKHTNKKLEYKCKYCPDVFTNRYIFIQHNSTHKKKNYVCEVCGLAYYKNWYLKRHEEKSAKPMKCRIQECNFETRSHCELQIHRPDHRLNKCKEPGCGKAYKTPKGLKDHKKKHR